jgi:parallel beta-helix repeat protein
MTTALALLTGQFAAFANETGEAVEPLSVYTCDTSTSTSITLNSGSVVDCDSGDDWWLRVEASDVVIDLNGSRIRLNGGNGGIRIDGDAVPGGTIRNVTIKNGTIEGYDGGEGIYIDEAENIRLQDVTLTSGPEDESNGIYVDEDVTGLVLERVTATHHEYDNVYFHYDVSGVTIIDSVFGNSEDDRGIYVEDCVDDLTIIGGEVGGNQRGGIIADCVTGSAQIVGVLLQSNGGAGIYTVGAGEGSTLAMDGVRAVGNAGIGIDVRGYERATIRSSSARLGLVRGIYLESIGSFQLRGNLAEDNAGEGFELYDLGAGTVDRNTASGNPVGFSIFSSSGLTVSRNVARDNNVGFYMYEVERFVFSRNRSESNNFEGFEFDWTSSTRFDRNVAVDNGTNGFLTDDSGDQNRDLRFDRNVAEGNGDVGFLMTEVDGTLRMTGNRASGNGYGTTPTGADATPANGTWDHGFYFDWIEVLDATRNRATHNAGAGFYFDDHIGSFRRVRGNRAQRNDGWGLYHSGGYLIGQRNSASRNFDGQCFDVRCGRRQTVLSGGMG